MEELVVCNIKIFILLHPHPCPSPSMGGDSAHRFLHTTDLSMECQDIDVTIY